MARIEKYIPVTQAKSQLLDVIRQMQNSDDTVAITKNGPPCRSQQAMPPSSEIRPKAGPPLCKEETEGISTGVARPLERRKLSFQGETIIDLPSGQTRKK
jgi:hypothetical protein